MKTDDRPKHLPLTLAALKRAGTWTRERHRPWVRTAAAPAPRGWSDT